MSNFSRNPFESDEEGDIMDLSEALQRVEEELNNQPYLENFMSETNEATETTAPKKAAAKKVVKKAEAPAAKKAAPAKKTPAAKAPAKKAAAEKEPKLNGPRSVPEGYTGLAELAEEHDMSPAAVRRVLRNNDVTKPEGEFGWKWKTNSRELAAVKKLLK